MLIACVGLTHHTAPVSLREQLALAVRLEAAVSRGLMGPGGATELVVLQTCYRTEVYGAGTDNALAARLVDFVVDVSGWGRGDIEPHLALWSDGAAVRHLMAVAAGLDSLILGEAQILGQVRAALNEARTAGTAGPVLGALFTAAVRAGRRARRETDIGRGAASVPSAAVALACRAMPKGTIADRVVVVVGAGKMGLLTAQALLDHGVRCIAVSNRSFHRALDLARRWGGQAVPFAALADTIARADIVITSTGAPHAVIHPAQVAAAMARRPERPLVIVDIAVPRDVEPAVAEVPGVQLYGLDDLSSAVADNLAERALSVPAVEAIVAEEAHRFGVWLSTQRAAATISALYRWAEGVRAAELERHLRRLGELGEREHEVVRALSVALVGKLLHPAVTHLKNDGAEHHAEVVEALFGLERPVLNAPLPAAEDLPGGEGDGW